MTKTFEKESCRPQSLTLYCYGELNTDERLWVENHLQACASCRRDMEQLRSTLDSLPKGKAEMAPEDVRAFNERVVRQLPRQLRFSLRPALGWSLAGAAAVLVIVLLQWPASGPHPPSPEVTFQRGMTLERMPDPDLLLNLELLETLDLLEQLEERGERG